MSQIEFKKRIAEKISANNMNPSEVASELGIRKQNVYNWVNMDMTTIPAADTAVKLAALLGTSVEYLATGAESGTLYDNNVVPFEIKQNENEINIPMLAAAGSMGAGVAAELGHDEVISNLSVSKQFINENLGSITSLNNLRMVTGLGNSMQGMYEHGDMLFADTGVNSIEIDAVYVVLYRDHIYIKNVQRIPTGGIKLISSNKDYEPLIIEGGELEHTQVLARVAGAWNFRKI